MLSAETILAVQANVPVPTPSATGPKYLAAALCSAPHVADLISWMYGALLSAAAEGKEGFAGRGRVNEPVEVAGGENGINVAVVEDGFVWLEGDAVGLDDLAAAVCQIGGTSGL